MQEHQQVIRQRKKRERDQRIQGILTAAKKVFFSKGYQRTTMDEIAFEAEISKPTIYQYFKTKDELYSALMLPFLEEFSAQFEKIDKKLKANRYTSGKALVQDFFKAFLKSYDIAPDSLRVAHTFFQHSDLINELTPDTRAAISSQGKYDFELARQVLETAIAQGLIKDLNTYILSDIVWGLFVGITQVMDMKSTKRSQPDKYLRSTLKEAEKLIIDAIVLK
ncbi:MAG TPA: TetR/AcrR family transcriptional regulator [Deltaproteobacteria bacterium]|nr:TetR/AcrR family transcriptional regulator [Deltaproteobacteria bacterium]HPJ94303.1 TetR/AcrR family transcriptional regulator [Deltaproteobacteria bacterium]HPR51789.1 TetR/AcrR family transcriptional regulator [Deltaproteobacteria bacterium]